MLWLPVVETIEAARRFRVRRGAANFCRCALFGRGGIAVHLHETGDCSGDGFKSAGGHIAGDREHGVLTAGGPHPGDMPNVTVGSDGTVEQEVFLPFLNVEEHLMDDDGAAFVIHGGQDDYSSQPSGDAGDRIACGVFGADPA